MWMFLAGIGSVVAVSALVFFFLIWRAPEDNG
jgi:hypothetical protein